MNLFRKPTSLEQARSLFRKKRVPEAIPFFITAIEENRDVANASLELGVCLQLEGHFIEAERAFKISTQENTANSKSWELLSLTQSTLGKLDEAVVSAEKSISTALDKNQELMAKIALLQVLSLLLHRFRPEQYDTTLDSQPTEQHLENAKRQADLDVNCKLIATRMLSVIQGCQQNPKAPKEELWRFYTLVGIYTFDCEASRRGFSELQQMCSGYLNTLMDLYFEMNKLPGGKYIAKGLPENLRPTF